MLSEIFKSEFESNLVSLLDITLENIVNESTNITSIVLDFHEFWKSTLYQIFVECCPTKTFCRCRKFIGVHIFIHAEFLERERVQCYRFMTTGKMCSQFCAEKFCVRSGNNHPHLLAEKTIHEKIPSFYILDFVKE